MRLYSALAVAALATASLAAHADTITNTFTFAPLSGYSSEPGTSFAQFDPKLGTLNSVTLNFSGTVTFSGGGDSDFNFAIVDLHLGSDTETADVTKQGNGSGTFNLANYTYSSSYGAYVGTGLIESSVQVENENSTRASVYTRFNTETLTYNYTPAAAPVATTPEPSSLALLGTGLLGAFGVARKRFAQ